MFQSIVDAIVNVRLCVNAKQANGHQRRRTHGRLGQLH